MYTLFKILDKPNLLEDLNLLSKETIIQSCQCGTWHNTQHIPKMCDPLTHSSQGNRKKRNLSFVFQLLTSHSHEHS